MISKELPEKDYETWILELNPASFEDDTLTLEAPFGLFRDRVRQAYLPAIERAGLYATDVEILRLHYAKTLKEWRRRFNENRAKVAALYDERFCRMWEFYLASSEMCFRYDHLVNFQIQLTRKIDALPLTRSYMFENDFSLSREQPNLAG